MKTHKGLLPLGDKSTPEAIAGLLSMSKKSFKKAIGGLYKEGLIDITRDGIRLRSGMQDICKCEQKLAPETD